MERRQDRSGESSGQEPWPGGDAGHRVRLLPMANAVRCYDWGSHTVLAALQGRRPAATREAELWLGAHPSASSAIREGDGEYPLASRLAERPQELLGQSCLRRFGPRLPFLLKVLAVERALSVQLHPTGPQAEQGFADEQARGVPVDAPHRVFRDPFPKPELVAAVTGFEALAGLRPAASALALVELLGGQAAARLAPPLRRGGAEAAVGAVLHWPPTQRAALVREVVAGLPAARAAAADAAQRRALDWVAELAEQHPCDPLVLAPVLLQWHHLEPGQALYVPPGAPHAYLNGVGVEIMVSSDNVVRAGLTSKPVAVDLVEQWLDPAARPLRLTAEPLQRRDGALEQGFAAPCPEFSLSRVVVAGTGSVRREVPGPEILLCLEGTVTVTAGSDRLELDCGESLLVTSFDRPFDDSVNSLGLSGSGVLYRATVGAERVRLPEESVTSRGFEEVGVGTLS